MNSEIPIGFRFNPTDEELLRGFLIPHVIGDPLPWNGIIHKALYSAAAPWQVLGDCYWETRKEGGATKSTTYVFTDLVRAHNSTKRISRTAGGGTWGGQTGPKKILCSVTGETIGHMRILSYEHPDFGASSEYAHWIMHEYVLSEKLLKGIAKPGAGDKTVCKITRCVKNSRGNRNQTPQLQFFPPAVVNFQENGCVRAAEESSVQELQETASCTFEKYGDHQQPPQPQFFPPAVVNFQENGCARAAEESSIQELQETVSCAFENYVGDHQQPPQPQFFPPTAVVGVQETGRRRAAEEPSVQEVHEPVSKKNCIEDDFLGYEVNPDDKWWQWWHAQNEEPNILI